MNLLQIRTDFVKESGRYDLVVDAAGGDYSDNGADKYINSGQKLLDQLVTRLPENVAKIYEGLAIDEYSVTWDKQTRSIEEVWVNNTEERWELEKKTLSELKELYPDSTTLTESGEAKYYAIAELRALETTDRDSLATFINLTRDETDTDYTNRSILIVPPTDEALVVEVSGKFHQFELSSDTDENFWSIRYPLLLLSAARYRLEGQSRGTEDRKQWITMIKTDVMEIEKDTVEEDTSDIDNMEG